MINHLPPTGGINVPLSTGRENIEELKIEDMETEADFLDAVSMLAHVGPSYECCRVVASILSSRLSRSQSPLGIDVRKMVTSLPSANSGDSNFPRSRYTNDPEDRLQPEVLLKELVVTRDLSLQFTAWLQLWLKNVFFCISAFVLLGLTVMRVPNDVNTVFLVNNIIDGRKLAFQTNWGWFETHPTLRGCRVDTLGVLSSDAEAIFCNIRGLPLVLP